LKYAVLIIFGLAVLRFNQGGISYTMCITDARAPTMYQIQNSTLPSNYPIIHSYTRCVVWEYNSVEAFGVRLQEQIHPSCLTATDVAMMQVKALKDLGVNSSWVEEVNKWLANNALEVVWQADRGVVEGG
jgi:hypothetical protein